MQPERTDPLTAAVRSQAVLQRDPAVDGRFVDAVRSTRVYCRPSCPSRRPRRDRVVFFDHPSLAAQASFRACRRCRPDRAATDPARQLAEQEPRANPTVSRAQYAAGYGSSSRLYERASQRLGMTPGAYRNGGAGRRIGYRVLETSLGQLLVAGTERGVCTVRFGSSVARLIRDLAREFPQALLVPDDPRVSLWARTLQAQVEGLKPNTLVPLDVQATPFQWQVWRELRRIPFGARRSYRQVAADLGRPAAARAVARACATNPAAVAIPCHRVIREDGSLGGYRWGIERKRALLAREAQAGAGGRAQPS